MYNYIYVWYTVYYKIYIISIIINAEFSVYMYNISSNDIYYFLFDSLIVSGQLICFVIGYSYSKFNVQYALLF